MAHENTFDDMYVEWLLSRRVKIPMEKMLFYMTREDIVPEEGSNLTSTDHGYNC
jgi:hypothetical protein